jgi:hypothetical protein
MTQPVPKRISRKRAALFDRAQQAENKGNRETRDLWERFRIHRHRVTAEILALAPAQNDRGGGRLCLLGAGNANDLDLDALAACYDEVHLVDIDPSALDRAMGRQSPPVRARLRLHAPVDLSGLYHLLDRPANLPSADAIVNAGMAEVLRQLPGDFDVVASCCVASQMSWAIGHLATPDPTLVPMLEQSLLRVHLRTMLRLIRPMGAALLVSDLTSSLFFPPLDELAADVDLRALAHKLAEAYLAYTVCNPILIRQILRRDEELAATCEVSALGYPWLWAGPKALTYLVYPTVLRRRS